MIHKICISQFYATTTAAATTATIQIRRYTMTCVVVIFVIPVISLINSRRFINS